MDLYYRIFVSDSWENLNWTQDEGPRFPPNYDQINPAIGMLLNPAASPGGDTIPMFRRDGITQYTRRGAEGIGWEDQPIRTNGVYFVRIEAVREMPGRQFISSPSFGVIYVPPDSDLVLTPEMIDAPPLRGTANAPGQTPSITLNWDLRYLEIGEPPTSAEPLWNRWHASVGVDLRGGTERLIFGRNAQHIPDTYIRGWGSLNSMLTPATLAQLRDRSLQLPVFIDSVRADISRPTQLGLDTANFPLRIQDMFDRHYRIHAVPHAQLMTQTQASNLADAYEEYRDRLLEAGNDTLWTSIGRPTPAANGTSSHTITAISGGAALLPNTAYVVFLQPYEPALPGRPGRAFFPNYVIVTTPDVFIPAVPVPTTPVLFPGMAPTDTTLGVRWRVQEGENPNPRTLFFELSWSESILSYPQGAGTTIIPWTVLEAEYGGRFSYWTHPATREVYYHFTLDGLFPDTAHYIWARAFNVNNVSSGWSNPIELRTRDISPPPPPRLGLASHTHLHAYNLANATDYAPIEPNAISFFLARVFSDFREHELPRAAGGVSAGGSASLIGLPNLDEIYDIRFDGLLPNRDYYARARTILTVVRGGSPNRNYTYEVQLADNPDFLDAIVFTIPALTADDPINARRAISGWTQLEVSTAPSGDEFDGAFRPEQFPLPEEDWEITYQNGSLVWRFRTHRTGADGRPDQQADQRFISRLIDSRAHRYEIDLSVYPLRPDWPVDNREVEIPLSIIRAFNERLITLAVNFGDITLEFPPGAFDTAAVRGLNMGTGSHVRIGMRLNQDAAGLPALPNNNRFATIPQRLTVTAVTPQRTLTLNDFAKPIDITLSMDGLITPDGINTGMFFAPPQAGNWLDTNAPYSFASNHLRTQVSRPGTIAAVVRETPHTTRPADPTVPAMNRVTARLTFTDMFEYNPHGLVSANGFNQVMNALSNNRSAVNMSASLSSAERQGLERARFLAPADLTREAATDILVRFYELRTRRIIEPMTTAQMVPGISDATPSLRNSLLKAADIGFITGPVSPGGALTMGDLMVMLDIIIMDTGF
jgi:hypothetical protein